MSAPKYPYKVVNDGVMIKPEDPFKLMAEPAWKNAKVRDTMAEYMRRAAEECGEGDEAETVQFDSSKPIQLRCALPGKTPAEVNTILAQLQKIGLNSTVTLEPATMEQVRQECDHICDFAQDIAEHSDEEDALGFVLDSLIAMRKKMLLELVQKQQSD